MLFNTIRSRFGRKQRELEAEARREAELAQAAAACAKRESIASMELLGRTVVATVLVADLTAPKVADLQVELFFKLSSRPDARHLVLDLQNVEYLDSACLGMLLQLLRRVREGGGRIAIASVKNRIEGLFKLTRLEQLFPIKRTVLDAVAAVERM